MDRDPNSVTPRLGPGRLLLGLAGLAIVALAALYLPALREAPTPWDSEESDITNAADGTGALAVSPGDEPHGRTVEHASDPDAVSVEPGVVDVQEWEWLEQDLEMLLKRTDRDSRDRLTPEEFRAAFLEATVKYLKLEGEERERFERGAESALSGVQKARDRLKQTQSSAEPKAGWDMEDQESARRYRAAWSEFRREQQEAGLLLAAALERRPRTQLLYEESLRWVLRLDYGIRGAAER